MDKQLDKKRSLSQEKSSAKQQQPEIKAEVQALNVNKQQYITLGICAMKKKVESKPMKQILGRIRCDQIQILEMWQFLDSHYSKWPKVDALICFYSDGFPYLMAWKYVRKHKPFLFNNLDKQQLLWDRTAVYDILKKIKVPVAKHFMIFRDKNYIDEIEAKAFGKNFNDQKTPDSPVFVKKEKSDLNSEQKIRVKPKMSLIQVPELGSNSYIDKEDQMFEGSKFSKLSLPNQTGDEEVNKQIPECMSARPNLKHLSIKRQRPTEQENSPTCSPNTLRSFHQRRLPELIQYTIEEVEDHILIKNGQTVNRLNKPFVEKPFDAENHQICVYYPESMGGGRKMLFRKVKNKCSQYQTQQNQIRKDGNYIYEQFLPTNAFDIKVYTIGPYYMYAEARRSPTLDGVVQRNSDGKQIRFPVILTPDEKFICYRIVQQFGQEVCGFDLLRANGKSYVCDVNGWSFVKANPKYWEDCAKILKKKIFGKFFPELNTVGQQHHYQKFMKQKQNQYRPPMDILYIKKQELRSIVSIFRHGDRSPKLKLKIKTSDPRFLQFFSDKNKDLDELKLKDAANLTKILNITNSIIASLEVKRDSPFKDWSQMKTVLQSGGHFQGFTRKLQLKVKDREEGEEGKGKVTKVEIVLKWGGELTWLGYQDSIQLGKKMRVERYDDNDCLSLYSSYRHDLKSYSSDEGRCIKTAAAFLKGFLNIEGELAPIITSMITFDKKAQRLLDCTSEQNHSQLSDKFKVRLTQMLNSTTPLMQSYLQYVSQEQICPALHEIMKEISNPKALLTQMYDHIKKLVKEIQKIELSSQSEHEIKQVEVNDRSSTHQIYNDQMKCEKIMMVYNRWLKLLKDFQDKETKLFNISKIPEIHDTLRHDLRKNQAIFDLISKETKESLRHLSKLFAYFVVPNQYGMAYDEKVSAAKSIAGPLLGKILIDLMFWKEKNSEEHFWKYKNEQQLDDNWRHIRTRLYFTSASHMHSLVNIFVLGNDCKLLKNSPKEDAASVKNILLMGYLSHIELRLYQNLMSGEQDPNRFRLEFSISTEYRKGQQMKEFGLGGEGFTINQIKQFIEIFDGDYALTPAINNTKKDASWKKVDDFAFTSLKDTRASLPKISEEEL